MDHFDSEDSLLTHTWKASGLWEFITENIHDMHLGERLRKQYANK